MTTKSCFKCLCEKPVEAFYKHSRMGDGRLNKCIECTKNDARVHRELNLEKVRDYDRRRAMLPHRMSLSSGVIKEWRKSHPEIVRAHNAVARALKAGKINRHPCLVCGEKAVAHHPDYSRPLDVVWLCQAHHKQAHAILI